MSLTAIKDRLFRFPDEKRFWQTMLEHCQATFRRSVDGRAYEHQDAWDFATWEDLLSAAVDRGVAAVIVDDSTKPEAEQKIVAFAGPFGYALLERWRWLQDAKRRGITPQQAEDEFSARVDRIRASNRQRVAEQDAIAQRRQFDRRSPRRRSEEAEI